MVMPRKLKKCDDAIALKDRISSLHDVLLAEILSSLPSKDAVATCVLSKRWRHVFTWVIRLDFDDSPISHCMHRPHLIDSFPVFKMYVDKLLQGCQSENITTYRLHFGKGEIDFGVIGCEEDCYPEMEPLHVNAWISFPLTRGVTELDIRIRVRKPSKLPSAVFGCQTLEVLKLNMNLDLEVPPYLCLSKLKEFHLTLLILPDDDSVTRLVSSCPSLEHLVLEGLLKPANPIHISSLSLRSLVIVIPDGYGHPRSKLVLDVPNLEYLVYGDTFALHYSIGELNSLVEAKVDTTCLCTDERQLKNIYTLVGSLSNVARLFLMQGCVMALSECELKQKLPVFGNLKHLQLGCFGYYEWNKVLMFLLNCTPFLEMLAFPNGIVFNVDDDYDSLYVEVSEQECRTWSRTQVIPSCFGFHLKRMSIEMYERTEWELEMVKYFMRNTLVLEELVIVCHTSVAIADRILLDSTLQMLPSDFGTDE